MGDRVTVDLTVLAVHAEQTKDLLPGWNEDHTSVEDGERVFTLVFYEVNYGELKEARKLRDYGIAYTSRWYRGNTFDRGKTVFRFTPQGKIITKDIYEYEYSIPFEDLLPLIDQPDHLANLVRIRHESLAYPSWVGQAEYGKRYLTRKLILSPHHDSEELYELA